MIRVLIWTAVVLTALSFIPAASPTPPGASGELVFFSQYAGENEIWVMNADGSDRRNLTRHSGVKMTDLDPSWSPDGDEIAFARGPGVGGSLQIWLMNADGSNQRQLTDLPGRNRFPSWTANGTQIVFQSFVAGQFEIYRIDVDGTGAVNLTNHAAVDWSPATSPHGKKIVFTSERDGNGHLHVLDSEGAVGRITSTPGYDSHASWSPRGNRIVFLRQTGADSDLYLVNADGTGERRLTNTPGQTKFFPTFSPDGRKVAYSACVDSPPFPNPRCSTRILELASDTEVDLAFPPLVAPNPFFDGFDTSQRDVERWSVNHQGSGAFVDWTNQRVEISFTPEAQAFPPSTQIEAHTGFNCVLLGDFDASVDYELLEWPPVNGVYVFLNAFFGDASAARISQPWGEQYDGFVSPNFASALTTHLSGSFRLVRSAGVMTAYYRDAGVWVALASAPASPNPVIIGLAGASQSAGFAAQPVRFAFDNFRLDAALPTRDCSSSRPDLNPDWHAVDDDGGDDDDD